MGQIKVKLLSKVAQFTSGVKTCAASSDLISVVYNSKLSRPHLYTLNFFPTAQNLFFLAKRFYFVYIVRKKDSSLVDKEPG